MKPKNVLITGATEGIGRATAESLARLGFNLFILCRNPKKGQILVEALHEINPTIQIQTLLADLGNFQQVRQAAQSYLDQNLPLDVLINNAGLLNTSRVLLPNGLEQMFAVNHLGHFLLTQCLMPALQRAESSRIVVVASDAYFMCHGIRFDDLSWENGFGTFKTYGHSKLANIHFMRALARRLEGTTVTVNGLHPGGVATGLGKQNSSWTRLLAGLARPFLRSPEKASRTVVYLVSDPELAGVNGQYFMDQKPHKLRDWAMDRDAEEKLWTLSETLVGKGL